MHKKNLNSEPWMSCSRYRLGWSILILLVLLSQIGHVAATEESKIKAAFIEKLTRFIDWPAQNRDTLEHSFSLCVINEDTFSGALDQLAKITPIKGRELIVRYLRKVGDINNCHALFITSSMADKLPAILKLIKQRPVLTIGDTEGYAAQGVMINFFHEAGHLRFEINQQAAETAGIKVGSRVLKLARIVEGSE